MLGRAWTWQEPEESRQSISQEQPEVVCTSKKLKFRVNMTINLKIYEKEQIIEQKCLC